MRSSKMSQRCPTCAKATLWRAPAWSWLRPIRGFQGARRRHSNKTEILLGYTTVYGDAACALNPSATCTDPGPQLALALHIPEVIIAKPPSADLWNGQTDEGELGFTYEEVDRLLYLFVDQRYRPEECVEAGFDKKLSAKSSNVSARNQFKRILPTIAKLSSARSGTISYICEIGELEPIKRERRNG